MPFFLPELKSLRRGEYILKRREWPKELTVTGVKPVPGWSPLACFLMLLSTSRSHGIWHTVPSCIIGTRQIFVELASETHLKIFFFFGS